MYFGFPILFFCNAESYTSVWNLGTISDYPQAGQEHKSISPNLAASCALRDGIWRFLLGNDYKCKSGRDHENLKTLCKGLRSPFPIPTFMIIVVNSFPQSYLIFPWNYIGTITNLPKIVMNERRGRGHNGRKVSVVE